MYQHLLVPLDGSRFGEKALPRALTLAAGSGARLSLVTVAVPAPGGSRKGRESGLMGDESREEGTRRAEAYLGDVTARIRDGGYTGELSTELLPAGNAAHAVVRHGVEIGADLVIMTTHGRGPIQRAWLGSTADGVIRRSPVPVLLLRSEEEESDAPVDLSVRSGAFRTVLVPLDGSRAAEALLDRVPPLMDPDGSLILLRAIAPLVPAGSPYLPHAVREGKDHERLRSAAREYLEGVASEPPCAGRDAEARVVVHAQPGLSILETAREEPVDLIAMSTAGRGGVGRLLLGSVADKVIRAAPCPVLVFREPAEE